MIKSVLIFLCLLSVAVVAQQIGTPRNIRVITDANNNLLAKNTAQVLPLSQPTTFINARVRTDSNGNLMVTGVDDTNAVWGNITGTLSNQTDLQNALNAKQNVATFDAGPFQALNSVQVVDGLVTSLTGATSLSTTITTTGNIAQLATTGSRTILMNNASLSTIQGILAPVNNGQMLTIISIGAGQVDLANQSGSASAADRIANLVTGTISLAAGVGRVDLVYDGANSYWRVINHDQGDWITPTFAAGDYTGNASMTWTVASGDAITMKYYLRGRMLTIAYFLNATTVGGTPSTDLRKTIPGGFTISGTVRNTNHVINNGVVAVGLASAVNGDTIITFQLASAANWTASTDNTGIQGVSVFSVQ